MWQLRIGKLFFDGHYSWKLFEGEMSLKKHILVNFPCFTRWNRKNMGKKHMNTFTISLLSHVLLVKMKVECGQPPGKSGAAQVFERGHMVKELSHKQTWNSAWFQLCRSNFRNPNRTDPTCCCFSSSQLPGNVRAVLRIVGSVMGRCIRKEICWSL